MLAEEYTKVLWMCRMPMSQGLAV